MKMAIGLTAVLRPARQTLPVVSTAEDADAFGVDLKSVIGICTKTTAIWVKTCRL